MTETLHKRFECPPRWSDVTPVFVTDSDAEPGNVVPALARLLIDVTRLTTERRPNMLNVSKELPQWALN